jgi:fatty acid desaturase
MENMDEIATSSGADGSGTGEGNADVAGGSSDVKILPPKDLKAPALRKAGLLDTSDAEGLMQLAFHLSFLALCAGCVSFCYSRGYWCWLLLAELPFGVGISFLFNALHEMIHNTAFRTPWLNHGGSQVLGFLTFRGAMWLWCFHWHHHRFTNDPVKDPELSGGSLDLDDPTRSLSGYFAFLSGYPFGFERVPNMFRRALGDCSDPWVVEKPEKTRSYVRVEAIVYCAGYSVLGLSGLLLPVRVGLPMVLYWLLPHCLGAGHLRMYQFAEHRACTMGTHTDTNAWVCSRTTATWWLYRKLAWQMPYHVEHHAFPNVPFHKLQALHEMIKAQYIKEGSEVRSGCNPDGKNGFTGLHVEMFSRMLSNVSSARGTKAAKAA